MLAAPLSGLEAWTDHFARLDLPILRRTAARLEELRREERERSAEIDAQAHAGLVRVLRVDLNELQMALAKRWHLPALLALLAQMMDDHHAESVRVRNVLLAVRLARHSAKSWDNPALPYDYRDIAALLSVSPSKVLELVGAPPPEEVPVT